MLLGLQDWQYYNIIRAQRSFTNWSSLRRGLDWWHLQELTGDVALAINKRVDLGRNVAKLAWTDYNGAAGWSNPSGEIARHTAGDNAFLFQNSGVTFTGKTWKTTYTVSNRTVGQVRILVGSNGSGTSRTTNSTFIEVITGMPGGIESIVGFSPSSDFDGDINLETVLVEQTDIAASTDFPGPEKLSTAGSGTIDKNNWTEVNATVSNPVPGTLRVLRSGGAVPFARQSVLTVGERIRIQGTTQGDGTNTPVIQVGGVTVFTAQNATDEEDFDFEVTVTVSGVFDLFGGLTIGNFTEWRNLSVTPANPMNGDNNGMAVAQPAGGFLGLRYLGDGGATYLDLTSAEHNSKLDPTEFHVALWFQKDTWDTTERDILSYTVDADNWIRIVDTTTAGTLSFQFRAGGVTEEVTLATGSPTTDVPVGISVSGGVMKAWYGTGQTGSNQAVAGTFVYNFVTMLAFARTPDPTFVHLGAGSHIMTADHELSTDEWANLATRDGV